VTGRRFRMAGHVLRLLLHWPAGVAIPWINSNRWQMKKWTPEGDVAQNIPERHGEGQDHRERS